MSEEFVNQLPSMLVIGNTRRLVAPYFKEVTQRTCMAVILSNRIASFELLFERTAYVMSAALRGSPSHPEPRPDALVGGVRYDRGARVIRGLDRARLLEVARCAMPWVEGSLLCSERTSSHEWIAGGVQPEHLGSNNICLISQSLGWFVLCDWFIRSLIWLILWWIWFRVGCLYDLVE